MLVDFRTENYKSFQKEVSFSMIPAPKQKGLDYSILKEKIGHQTKKAICSSVIYGPNASGKTNIIGAMDTLRSIVLRGNILNVNESNPNAAANNLELIPNNKLTKRKPVRFYIAFTENNYFIEFQISLCLGFFLEKDYERFIDSELLRINGLNMYERHNDQLTLNNLNKLASLLEIKNKDLDDLIHISTNSLNTKELFLTNGFKLIISRKMADLIQNWFKNKFMVIYKANALELIRRFDDTDTPGIYVEKTTNEAAKIFGLHANAIGYMHGDEDSKTKLCSVIQEENSKKNIVINSKIYESYGTLRFINIFPLVLKAMSIGGTLVIDEFDASIHPMALMSIINIFHDYEINIKHAQLIFDTHNPIFLNSNLLRRDEIKFVERHEESEISELYALSDFKTSGSSGVRKNEDYMKNYFVSRYGAIEDIDFSPVFQEVISKEGEK